VVLHIEPFDRPLIFGPVLLDGEGQAAGPRAHGPPRLVAE
jgi:hypothetical protein